MRPAPRWPRCPWGAPRAQGPHSADRGEEGNPVPARGAESTRRVWGAGRGAGTCPGTGVASRRPAGDTAGRVALSAPR